MQIFVVKLREQDLPEWMVTRDVAGRGPPGESLHRSYSIRALRSEAAHPLQRKECGTRRFLRLRVNGYGKAGLSASGTDFSSVNHPRSTAKSGCATTAPEITVRGVGWAVRCLFFAVRGNWVDWVVVVA